MVAVRSHCCLAFSLLLAALLLGVTSHAPAATIPSSRAELMFALSSAVKERNKEGILACFNLDGADEGTRRTIDSAVSQICRWPTNHVFSTERSGSGPLLSSRGGHTWGLNGDWQFQVHVFLKAQQPSKGYVFPAGKTKSAQGRYAILLLVEEQR